MRRRFLVSAVLALACARPARACEGILEPIRSELQHFYRVDVSCEQLDSAAKVLRVAAVSPAAGTWGYGGEIEIRDDLWKRYHLRFSTGIVPLGILERDAPEGKGSLYIFGLEMQRRSWGLLAISQHEGRVSAEQAAAVLGEGASYDWVGVYRKDGKGGLGPEGEWIKLDAGGFWSEKRPAPIGEARACMSCQGWLCGRESAACFSDFNLNGREETLLIDDCQPYACGLRVLEPDAKGVMTVLFNEPGVYGEWTRRPQGWVLVPEVFCPWGEFCGEGEASLGNPNCERPDVYRFDARGGRLMPDPGLKSEYYPIENRRAPGACRVDNADGALVYAKDGHFIRYRP